MIDTKQPLMGLNANELRQVAIDLGLPAYTGGQMAKWLYEKRVTTIDEMTNLSNIFFPSGQQHPATLRNASLWKQYIFLTASVPHSACRVRWAAR